MLDPVPEPERVAREVRAVVGQRHAPRTVLGASALLTALVIGAVPAVALVLDVHPLPVLAIALGVYAIVTVSTDSVLPGVVVAIPVLTTVNADVPLWTGPNDTVEVGVVLADAAVLAGAGVLLAWLSVGRPRRPTPLADSPDVRRAGARAWAVLGWPAALLAAFACWALLGAAFAAHDPATAAAFGVSQLRYVGYFAVAAGLVAAGLADVRSLAVAFVVAVLGHAGFALAQFLHGDTFGLSVLGETERTVDHTITVLGQEMVMGRYLGGLVGNNAAFASLAVPAAAVLAWAAFRRRGDPSGRRNGSRGLVGIAALAGLVLLGALCGPLSQYDSATVAFVGTVAASLALSTLPSWPESSRRWIRQNRPTALGAAFAGTVVAVVAVLVVGVDAILDAFPLVTTQNLDTRIRDYETAIDLAVEHPVFGYGAGNVESVATELGFSDDVAIHSILLSYLAETGVVGAALWLAAVATTGDRALRVAWSDHRDAALVGVCCVGALGFLTVAMVDQIWDNHTSLGVFWLFAGAIAGAEYALEPPERSRGDPGS